MLDTINSVIQKNIKKNDKGILPLVIATSACVMFIVLIINLTIQRTYDDYSVIKSQARTDSSTKGYLTHNGDIIKYSEDGITVMDNTLKALWSASYNFKNPSVKMSEKYIAIADIGGTEVNVYDDKGNINKIDNSREICQIEVSDTGMVAIMAKEEMAYYITIINSTKKYIDIKTRIKEDGYPIDMAFSGDSQKLVTSYMNVDKGEVNNYVTYYNFGEVGKNYESKMVKFDSYGNVMVPKVEFMDDDTICVFSQERFIVYSMKEIPEEKFKSEKYPKNIKSVLCNEEYVGVIINDEEAGGLKLSLFEKNGKRKMTKEFNFDYDKAQLIKDDVVLSTENEAMIIRTSGKVKYKGQFKEEVEYIMPYNNRDRYIFITPQNIERIKFTN